jgi:LCP family protein required for cell wall assembly
VVRAPLDGRTAVNVLILGLDQKDKLHPEEGRRSDTILLARVDTVTRTVYGVSIPRDTRVRPDLDKGWTKINAAYTEGGPHATMSLVEDITGVRPDYYLVVDTASTRKLVDLVGGVKVDVDRRMKYDDNWQDLHIDLRPGLQTLDGDKAVQYLRFRHDALGDIRRMRRQQIFVRALAERVVAPANIPKLPWVMSELRHLVQTNLGDDDLLYLANRFRSVPAEALHLTSLEGESRTMDGISYFLPYKDKMEESLATAFPATIAPENPPVDTL